MNKKVLMSILGLILILGMAACAPAAQPQETQELGELNVNGTGEVYLTPDVAYVYIGVQSESENVADALDDNNKQAQAVSAALSELGVAREDIQTTAFNVYPTMEYSPMGEELGTKYVVENTVFVKVLDLQSLGSLLDTVVRSGANSINGVSFDVLDKEGAISEARKLAVEEAKKQAEELAEASGVELVNIKYLNSYYGGGAYPLVEAKAFDSRAMGGSSVPTAAGQLVVTVEANITYAIQSK